MAQPPPAVLRMLTSAFEAVRHAAKSLASVTHAANNHSVLVIAEDGTVSNKVVRDSVDKPRAKQKPKAAGLIPLHPPPPQKDERQVAAWLPTNTVPKRSANNASVHVRRAASIQEGHLRQRVQQIGARLRPASCRPASERLSDIRARLFGLSDSDVGNGSSCLPVQALSRGLATPIGAG